MHRAHVLGAALVAYILEKSDLSKVVIVDCGLSGYKAASQSTSKAFPTFAAFVPLDRPVPLASGLKSVLRPRQSAGPPSQNKAPYWGAAAVALLAIGLLLVTAEPWKVLWGLALSGAHLAHFLGWDPQTSIFWSTWGLSMAP